MELMLLKKFDLIESNTFPKINFVVKNFIISLIIERIKKV
jgi:hypothetical protein